MKTSVIIWDQNLSPPKHLNDKIIFWKEYIADSKSNSISIPQLIEESSEKLRNKFLLWVYDVGETKIDGKKLVDLLQIRPKFSYWWMTLITEKCNYSKSLFITDVIKIFALEDWINKNPTSKIKIFSSNKNLIHSLEEWCEGRDINFEYLIINSKKNQISVFKKVFYLLPAMPRGILWFIKFLSQRWKLKGLGLKNWINSDAQITFLSYLFNISETSKNDSNYENQYWTELPILLKNKKIKTNWLHYYIQDGHSSTVKNVKKFISNFNKDPKNFQTHVTIFSFLSYEVIINTVKDWLSLCKKNKNIQNSLFGSTDKKYLWHLFQEDWKNSIYGQVAFSNLLTLNLYEAALNLLPNQKNGLYLQENQGWEFGFINAWRSAGHLNLIGFPHSTVKFWDLRYFYHKESYLNIHNNPLPLPDKIACNGKKTILAYQDHGYPEKYLVEVESLRYLYLDNYFQNFDITLKKNNKLIVLGDYLKANTYKQLELLQKAVALLNFNIDISFKPHPACPIDLSLFPGIKADLTNDPLSNLLPEYNMVFASSTTSAAVDGYCAGLIVFTLLDGEELNMSPLRNCKNAFFVSNYQQLRNYLINNSESKFYYKKLDNNFYFNLNKNLDGWKGLLNI